MTPNETPALVLERLLKENHKSRATLAKDLGLTTAYISDVLNGKRGISVQLALKLEQIFSHTAEYWLNLQTKLDVANLKNKLELKLASSPSTHEGVAFTKKADTYGRS